MNEAPRFDGRAEAAGRAGPVRRCALWCWTAVCFVWSGAREVAALAGVATLAAFAWNISKDLRIARVEAFQVWQESEIYGLVFECQRTGVRMPEVTAELRQRLACLPPSLRPDEQTVNDASVRRALMRLTERDIVRLRPDFTYFVPVAGEPPGDPAPGEIARCHCAPGLAPPACLDAPACPTPPRADVGASTIAALPAQPKA